MPHWYVSTRHYGLEPFLPGKELVEILGVMRVMTMIMV